VAKLGLIRVLLGHCFVLRGPGVAAQWGFYLVTSAVLAILDIGSNATYSVRIHNWYSVNFQAMTRGRLATEWLWFNFPQPTELHDYSFLGADFRERERIKRKKNRWTARLERMPLLERQALLSAIEAFSAKKSNVGSQIAGSDGRRSPLAKSGDGAQCPATPGRDETAERFSG